MIRRLARYIVKSIGRHRTRSLLTICGIAVAMFLFCFIEGLQSGVREATEGNATRNSLIVYQQSRFCPATSHIPERYGAEIEKIPGVKRVLPVKMYVNNCRASLDTVTFRGVPPGKIVSGEKKLHLVSGSVEDFERRSDAALVGETLAARRNLKPGSRLQIGHVSVQVAGIFRPEVAGEDNVAYTHLDFLQRGRGVNSIGRVTQFEVEVESAQQAESISRRIDDIFVSEEIPTTTKSHKAFISGATGDLLGLINFTRWLGLLCVLVVLALTANTVYVLVQDRVREHAVLQTLGFSRAQLFSMVMAESLLLSVSGGVIGTGLAALLLHSGNLALGAEGVQISFLLSPVVIVVGIAASVLTGFIAALVPAIQAAVAPITDSLRRA